MLGMLWQTAGQAETGLLIKMEGLTPHPLTALPRLKHGRNRGNSNQGLGEASVMAALAPRIKFTVSHMHYENPGAQHLTAPNVAACSQVLHRTALSFLH